MADKNLLEDEIIDLTDLLEEGSTTGRDKQGQAKKKTVSEPDSFDLGKEISMDFDVSIEEIEHESPVLADELSLDLEAKPKAQLKPKDEMPEVLKEPLGTIEAEIDLAIQDKMEEVTLTPKEEEVLLKDEPIEEIPPAAQDEPTALREATPVMIEEISIPAAKPAPAPEPEEIPRPETPRSVVAAQVPAEVMVDALIDEFKKEMPAMLEGIVRPVVQELLQEIISTTRESLPGIVEKVIREEIERLKKL